MSFFNNLIKSFSPDFYKKAAYFKSKKAVAYIFLLVLAVSLMLSTRATLVLKGTTINFLKENREELLRETHESVFPITIKEGKVSAEVEQPYIKEFGPEGKSKFTVIVDTKDETAPLRLQEYGNAFLLTENKLFIQNDNNGATETKSHDLSRIKNLALRPTEASEDYFIISNNGRDYHITNAFLIEWINRLSLILWPLLVIFLYIFESVAKFSQIFIFSLYLLILNTVNPKKINYAAIFNICAFAITVPTAAAVVHGLIGFNLRFFNIFYVFLYLFYLTLGFNRTKESV